MVVAPDAVGDAVAWLQKSQSDAAAIADTGRKLVWDKHSLHARAEQLRRCLASIMSGRYLGSRWHDGDFVVDERAATADVRAAAIR